MKWIDSWIEKKLDERIKAKKKDLERLHQRIKALEDYVKQKSVGLMGAIDDAAEFLSNIERAVSVKENIETVMNASADRNILLCFEDVREDTLAKTRMYNPDADYHVDEMIPFEISARQSFEYEVPSGMGMAIMAVKFLDGDGWGKYPIILKGKVYSFFVKKKNGNEDGAIFRTRICFLRENERLKIEQTYGEGSLKCALYVNLAGERKRVLRERTKLSHP